MNNQDDVFARLRKQHEIEENEIKSQMHPDDIAEVETDIEEAYWNY